MQRRAINFYQCNKMRMRVKFDVVYTAIFDIYVMLIIIWGFGIGYFQLKSHEAPRARSILLPQQFPILNRTKYDVH